jgi:LacI family transcriptional regulator
VFTLRDVARLADVSIATASAVMSGKGTVSSKLKKRVEAAAEALDYQPDQVARSLAVRETHTIGMLIPDITNPFFTAVMQGVEDKARQSNYWVIYCNANKDGELERHYLSSLFARRMDGVLLAPTDPHTTLDRLIRRRIPVVLFDRIPADFSGAAVVTNNLAASRAAARYLIELGHKRIAIITGRLDVSNGFDRLEGFRQALQEAHLPLADEYCQRGDFSLKSGYQCGLQLMRLPQPPPRFFPATTQ